MSYAGDRIFLFFFSYFSWDVTFIIVGEGKEKHNIFSFSDTMEKKKVIFDANKTSFIGTLFFVF